nr:MAG TPA: hypothetical protein [Caudoviricetes sp.]
MRGNGVPKHSVPRLLMRLDYHLQFHVLRIARR